MMETYSPALFDKLSLDSSKKTGYLFWENTLSRDIENLLNDASRSACLDLKSYEQVEKSVLNLGCSMFSESKSINANSADLAQKIAKILAEFEPRLDSNSIRVVPVVDENENRMLAMVFDVHGASYVNGEHAIMELRIALDYSCGVVKVI